MALVATLQDDLKTALRSRDELRVSTIRLVLSAMNYARIELGHELSDDEAVGVLTRQAKQRRESIEQFQAARRQDLVDREAAELAVIEGYLPAQLTRDEIEAEARAMIAEVGATSPSDLGKVMGPLSRRLRGRADGKAVRDVVASLLGAGR